MSTKLKLYVGRKVIESLQRHIKIAPTQLTSFIQIETHSSKNNIELSVPLNVLENHLGISNVSEILKIQPDDIIKNINCKKDQINRKINFEIDRNIFIKDVIENCTIPDTSFESKNVIVEYSSPNIAKPFHVGHLRSTIIGNFIANLYNYLNNNVIRLNYLGDWGTQFGFIKVGLNKLNISNEEIKRNPIKLLYESYVHANKLAEKDPEINELARNQFARLENGFSGDLDDWKKYMTYTIDELRTTYKRLGVKFDVYNYESMYNAKEIQGMIETMKKNKLINVESDGKQTSMINDNKKVTLLKSDGTTVYLTRDLAAAVDRFKKYQFDQMYYVVENGQNDHFNALRGLLNKMDFMWVDRIKHIKFGRIHGISTRKGNVVFLKDLLDELQELMVQKQMESPNTKVPITNTEISDVLGVSCIIINDLKQRRQKDYQFSWDKALQVQGDSGIKLQYTHCRLCSLENNCRILPAQKCQPQFLEQLEVLILVKELGRFHDVLNNAQMQLEACILVTYLFNLCNHINRAFKVLRVKDQEPELASQRLLLFTTAKNILAQGMTILGLQPLTKM